MVTLRPFVATFPFSSGQSSRKRKTASGGNGDLLHRHIAERKPEGKILLRALREVAAGAGAVGMVGGQVADLEAESKKPTRTLVEYIHTRKTVALSRAAVRAGALVGGALGLDSSPVSIATALPLVWPFRWPTTFSMSKVGPTKPASALVVTPSYTK